jgi:hypothetical protein
MTPAMIAAGIWLWVLEAVVIMLFGMSGLAYLTMIMVLIVGEVILGIVRGYDLTTFLPPFFIYVLWPITIFFLPWSIYMYECRKYTAEKLIANDEQGRDEEGFWFNWHTDPNITAQ